MTTAWLLALLAASGASSDVREALPGEVSESLQHALAVPSARIVPVRWTGPSFDSMASTLAMEEVEIRITRFDWLLGGK